MLQQWAIKLTRAQVSANLCLECGGCSVVGSATPRPEVAQLLGQTAGSRVVNGDCAKASKQWNGNRLSSNDVVQSRLENVTQ